MTENQAYKNLIRRVRNAHVRYFFISLYFNTMQVFFYGLIIACLVAGVFKLLPWILEPFDLLIPLSVLILSFPLAMWITWRRRGTMKKTAILADKHLHLKEKISSALELGQQEEDADANWEWNESVLNDAHKAVQRLNLNKAFPLTNPKELRWVWVPAFVFLLTVFVLPQWDYIQKQKTAQADVLDRKEVKKEIQKLLQRQLVIERKAQEKETKVAAELSKQIKDLTAELSKGKIEKRDAFSKLSSLEQEWEKKKDQLEKMQSMMKEPLSMGMKPKMTNELMEAIEKNDFEKAAQALSKLQKQLKLGNIDKDGQQQLSDELKKMASLMNMDTPMAKALENAGQMLDASELSEALQPLQMAEMSMMDLNDLAEQMNMLQSALKRFERL